MQVAGIDYPDDLWSAIRAGRVIVFGGAGVSMGPPAQLGSFADLTRAIAAPQVPTADELLRPDAYLGTLRCNVHLRAARTLTAREVAPTPLHHAIVHLFRTAGDVRLVTTNFDLLFEAAAETAFSSRPRVFSSPALPNGQRFRGIVHLHGSVDDPDEMVLTDSDFGRAYLTENWATRFLVDVFTHHHVLFVGYSHDDVIVRYLARALPPRPEPTRFALVSGHALDSSGWEALNVHPIPYNQVPGDDHQVLSQSLTAVADRLSWPLGTWQVELRRLLTVAPKPALDDSEWSLIGEAFANKDIASVVLTDAVHPGWIGALHNRGVFGCLFSQGVLNDAESELGNWVANQVLNPEGRKEALSVLKDVRQLAPQFWLALAHVVSGERSAELGDQLPRLVQVLIATVTDKCHFDALSWVAVACSRSGHIRSAAQIVGCIVDRAMQRIGRDPLGLLSHRDAHLHVAWAAARDSAEDLARLALSVVVHLEDRRRVLDDAGFTWPTGDADSDNYYLTADDPDFKDRTSNIVCGILVESVSRTLLRNPSFGNGMIIVLASSASPLCRLLAARIQFAREDISCDELAGWVIADGRINDHVFAREFVAVAGRVFRGSADETRARLIDAVIAQRLNGIDSDTDGREYEIRAQLELLREFAQAAEAPPPKLHDAIAEREALQPGAAPVLRRPMFSNRSGWVRNASPWSVDDLLQLTPDEWWRAWTGFVPFSGDSACDDEFVEFNTEGVAEAVSKAVIKSPSWGLRLAGVMAEVQAWDSPLWPRVLEAISNDQLPPVIVPDVLPWLANDSLQAHQTMAVANAINRVVEVAASDFNNVVSLCAAATTLENHIAGAHPAAMTDDLLIRAINHPAGVIAQFWVAALDRLRRKSPSPPAGLPDPFRSVFVRLCDPATSWSGLSRAVLASRLSWFLSVDYDWTSQHLIPSFTSPFLDDRRAVWHGFLTWGQLSRETVAALSPAFLSALRARNQIAPLGDRLLGHAAAVIAFDTSIDRREWLAAIFSDMPEPDAVTFAHSLGEAIAEIPDDELHEGWDRWIRDYWNDRVTGSPLPIWPKEASVMLDWLTGLEPVFDLAVAIAIQMPTPDVQHGSLLHRLAEGDLVSRHSEAVCHLLRYIETASPPGWYWHELREVLGQLQLDAISTDMKAWLDDFKLRHHED